MRIDYDKESDSLYIELRAEPSTESEEVKPGIVFDFDANGKVVGIDIEHASEIADVQNLPVSA